VVKSVLERWGLADANVTRVEIGLINETYLIERAGERTILQKLNPIFGAKVHEDIDAVTRHLALKGVRTARLIPTLDGALWVEDGGVWRLQTFLDGVVREKLASPEQARSAGRLLGEFHRGLSDLDHEFQNRRLGVHDTPKHIRTLTTALAEHRNHRRYPELAPFLEDVLADAEGLESMPALPDRIVHGDPKISNVVFDRETDEALALIDLDTLARMPVVLELGDAFRSWCNLSGEDAREVRFELPLFEAAMGGYARGSRGALTAEERAAIVPATLRIITELAVRFGADALNESYFGWRSDRYPTRSHHNELRARGQFSLARSFASQRHEAETIVRAAFRDPPN
jgi:Ser/Thr protein kinase RdoA (MazF antagonist)